MAIRLDQLRLDPNSYLLPSLEESGDEEAFLGRYWSAIFDNELASWLSDPSSWPEPRTREMFDSWFDLKFFSVVYSVDGQEVSLKGVGA